MLLVHLNINVLLLSLMVLTTFVDWYSLINCVRINSVCVRARVCLYESVCVVTEE